MHLLSLFLEQWRLNALLLVHGLGLLLAILWWREWRRLRRHIGHQLREEYARGRREAFAEVDQWLRANGVPVQVGRSL